MGRHELGLWVDMSWLVGRHELGMWVDMSWHVGRHAFDVGQHAPVGGQQARNIMQQLLTAAATHVWWQAAPHAGLGSQMLLQLSHGHTEHDTTMHLVVSHAQMLTPLLPSCHPAARACP